MKKLTKAVSLVVGASMVFSLAGCTSSGSGSASATDSAAASTESTASAESAAQTEGTGAGYKIGLTNSFNGNTYRQQMEAYA